MTEQALFPQPVQPCRKVCDINAASAASLLEIEMPRRLFGLSGFVRGSVKSKKTG